MQNSQTYIKQPSFDIYFLPVLKKFSEQSNFWLIQKIWTIRVYGKYWHKLITYSLACLLSIIAVLFDLVIIILKYCAIGWFEAHKWFFFVILPKILPPIVSKLMNIIAIPLTIFFSLISLTAFVFILFYIFKSGAWKQILDFIGNFIT